MPELCILSTIQKMVASYIDQHKYNVEPERPTNIDRNIDMASMFTSVASALNGKVSDHNVWLILNHFRYCEWYSNGYIDKMIYNIDKEDIDAVVVVAEHLMVLSAAS